MNQNPSKNVDAEKIGQWKDAIQAELNSLAKREVFGPVV